MNILAQRPIRMPARQRGATLVIALLVLVLIMMIGIKFMKGGWLVILITILLLLLCFKIRNHYKQVEDKVRELDDILGTLSLGESTVKAEQLKPGEPTAVVWCSDSAVKGFTFCFRLRGSSAEGLSSSFLFPSARLTRDGSRVWKNFRLCATKFRKKLRSTSLWPARMD